MCVAWLPLRSTLYLTVYEGTDRAHGQGRMSFVLAGAVVLALWLTRRISIGWRYDVRQVVSMKEPVWPAYTTRRRFYW